MMTTFQIRDMMQFSTDRERRGLRSEDVEPIKDPVLADAEEEEITALWADDPGNQGA